MTDCIVVLNCPEGRQYQNKEEEKERKKRLSVDSATANIQSPNWNLFEDNAELKHRLLIKHWIQ